ncbi:MAG: sensor histidine kinase [Candidatus Pristimantibacillus sp.]
MELWKIIFKVILLLYVIILSYTSETAITPWYMLSILLYISVNISFYILKKNGVKALLITLYTMLIIMAALYVNPLLIVLIPVNIYEWVTLYVKNNGVALLLMLTPMAFLPHDILLIYGFVAVLSFVYCKMLMTYTVKIESYRDNIEKMNSDIQRLTNRLNDNNEYIRQSENMFKLEERNRISQEIHDKIGHSMTGALIQMEAAKRLIATDTEKTSELLQNAIHISKDGIESIRLVLKNMKPLTEQLGINRLKLFIDEFSATHSIKTALTHEGNVDLITPLHWVIIQQNATEAMTNTMKYSNANSVSVHIQVLKTVIKVVISDNGKGAMKVIKGLGIIGMEERTAAVNGTVIVDGSRGFSVTTLIPYTE